MFNFITVSLFIAVLATSFNPQLFQSFLLKKQLALATAEKMGTKKMPDDQTGMMQGIIGLASNQDMVKMMLQTSTRELKLRYSKD